MKFKIISLLVSLLIFPQASPAIGDESTQIVNCSIFGTFTIKNNVVVSSSNCAGSVIIPNVGHWVQQEAPLETNIALEGFLSQL